MTIWVNTYAGGTNGSSITTGGTGSGTPWDVVTIGTSATVQWDNTHVVDGLLAGKYATSATSATALTSWTTGTIGTPSTLYFRVPLYLTGTPAASTVVVRGLASGTQKFRVFITNAGKVEIFDSSNSLAIVTTNAAPTGQYCRIEGSVTAGTSGACQLLLYSNADDTSALETVSGTGNFLTGNFDQIMFGVGATAASIGPYWIGAGVGASDTALLGPYAVAVPLTDGSTLTDGLSVATGSTPVALADTATQTDALAVVSGSAVALADTQTLTDALVVVTGGPVLGVPFRPDEFPSARLIVEAAFGADVTASPSGWTWYDITGDVMYNPGIAGTWGRADETSQSQPSQLSFSLWNTSGAYSAYTFTGTYGSNVKRNTPVRVRRDLGSGPVVEYLGGAVGFTPTWDTTGRYPIVQVVAAGYLRILGQPKGPLASPMLRVGTLTLPVAPYFDSPSAYWPGEEGSGSTSSANTVIARNTLTATAGAPVWGTATPPPGSVGAIDVSGATDQLSGRVAMTGTGATWEVSIAFRATAGAAGAKRTLASWTMAGYRMDVWISDGTSAMNTVTFLVDSSDYSVSQVAGATTLPVMDGNWHHMSFVLTTSTPATHVISHMWLDGVVVDTHAFSPVTMAPVATLTVGAVYGLLLPAPTSIGDLNVCHVFVGPSNGSSALPMWSAMTGWTGEDPVTRMVRLCTEEGVALTVTGTAAIGMGPQLIDTLLANLRDCENSDMGVLYDGYAWGISYLSRSARYNQTPALTIDAGASQLSPPFGPVDDDQRTVNSFTASRSGGGSATVTDTTSPLNVTATGIGTTYPGSGTYNLSADSHLTGYAGWQVALGTVNGLRYPTMTTNFVQPQCNALAAPWLAQLAVQPLGWLAQVLNVTVAALNHPPGTLQLLIEGYTVTTDLHSWTVVCNCSNALPWQVFTVKDYARGRVDAYDSILATNINASTTTVPVENVGTFRPWVNSTDNAADFPFPIVVDGEVMTVTAATKTSSPAQLLTVTRATNGVVMSHAVNASVHLYRPTAIAL